MIVGSAGRLRPLNVPTPATVQVGGDGVPMAVTLAGGPCAVAVVQERWRIDEGWWWDQPVSRLYWRLVLKDGRMVTVYQDLIDETWWSQRT